MSNVVLLGVRCEIARPAGSGALPSAADPTRFGWSPLAREAVKPWVLRPDDPEPALAFALTEFVELDDGRRVTVRADRGFGVSGGSADPWHGVTEAHLVRDVYTTLLMEDDDPRPPREWLVVRLRELRIDAELAALEETPYLVEFERQILERLDA